MAPVDERRFFKMVTEKVVEMESSDLRDAFLAYISAMEDGLSLTDHQEIELTVIMMEGIDRGMLILH